MSQSTYTGYPNLPNTGYSNQPKPGNNPWSSMGTLKCGVCRDRRKRCEFDHNDLSSPCYYCQQHGLLPCVKELAPVQKEFQQKHMQAFATASSGGSRRVSDVAREYETAHPNAPPSQVLAYITGIFGTQQQQQPQQPSIQHQNMSPPSIPNYWPPYYYPATPSSKHRSILEVK